MLHSLMKFFKKTWKKSDLKPPDWENGKNIWLTSIEGSETLYQCAPNGSFVPMTSDLSPPANIIPKKIANPTTLVTHDWDGWPDGKFEQDSTEKEFEEWGKLQVHQAMTVNGGDCKGKKDALTWEAGKRSTCLCLGVIECDDPLCRIVIRPQTKRTDKQLQNTCKCGATLKHKTCSIISVLHTWSDGVHFSNSGFHTHCQPTHVLHLLPHEQLRFEEIVKSLSSLDLF